MKRKRQTHQSLRDLVDCGQGRRASFTLSSTTLEQVSKLARLYNMSPSAVVSHAIATRFHSDPIALTSPGVAKWFYDPHDEGPHEGQQEAAEETNGAHHSEL